VVLRAFEVWARRDAVDDDRPDDERDEERVEENRDPKETAPRVARDVSHAREGDHARFDVEKKGVLGCTNAAGTKVCAKMAA